MSVVFFFELQKRGGETRNSTSARSHFESVFRSNYSLLIFPSLTAGGFGDLHLVAMSQQKVQPGDVKPRGRSPGFGRRGVG